MMLASEDLQKLLRDTVLADPDVLTLEPSGFYDSVPDDAGERYISFGPFSVVPDDTDCSRGGLYQQQIDVWTEEVGDVVCKRLTERVKRAVHDRNLNLTDNVLIDMQVSLWRVMRDPDGLTSHGVVIVEAMIEEA